MSSNQANSAESQEESTILECWVEGGDSGKVKVVRVKKHGFGTRFDMTDVPDLIGKLASIYMSNGGLASKLPHLEKIIHESRRQYMQALQARSESDGELLNELEAHVNDFTVHESETWLNTKLSSGNDTDKKLEQERKLAKFKIVKTGDSVRRSNPYHDFIHFDNGKPMDCSNRGKMIFAKSLHDKKCQILEQIKDKKAEDCVKDMEMVRSLENRRDWVVSQLVDYDFPIVEFSL